MSLLVSYLAAWMGQSGCRLTGWIHLRVKASSFHSHEPPLMILKKDLDNHYICYDQSPIASGVSTHPGGRNSCGIQDNCKA